MAVWRGHRAIRRLFCPLLVLGISFSLSLRSHLLVQVRLMFCFWKIDVVRVQKLRSRFDWITTLKSIYP